MSYHLHLTITSGGIPVTIETGWDAYAQGYFLVVRRTDVPAGDKSGDAELFSTHEFPPTMPLPQSYDRLASILDGMGISLPAPINNDVRYGSQTLGIAA